MQLLVGSKMKQHAAKGRQAGRQAGRQETDWQAGMQELGARTAAGRLAKWHAQEGMQGGAPMRRPSLHQTRRQTPALAYMLAPVAA
jgi:hypothetical protein